MGSKHFHLGGFVSIQFEISIEYRINSVDVGDHFNAVRFDGLLH